MKNIKLHFETRILAIRPPQFNLSLAVTPRWSRTEILSISTYHEVMSVSLPKIVATWTSFEDLIRSPCNQLARYNDVVA